MNLPARENQGTARTMDDLTLWELWRSKRDAEAFAEIVSRHAAMVHSVSRRILREFEKGNVWHF